MESQAEEGSSNSHLPATLGRYELLGALGQGGMANVYLARLPGSAGFQRLYAVKVLHPHLANEEAFVEMLLDEARIAARLHHPNVVPVVDLGTDAGLHYIVMEYVEGFPLSALLKRSADGRPPRLLIPLILDALAGLHAAHSLTDDEGNSLHLVHRDVSPQNILVSSDGVARITDFGIAKAESRINSTRPGELKGKLSFMSPEQIRDPESVDFRSDVFSAGVLLWSALTGEQLFTGANTAATLDNILRLEIPPPSGVGLKPPQVFDAVCMRALERNPARRTASAQEMEEALRAVATENGMLASRRQIAEWVRASFSQEFRARREVIRGTLGRPGFPGGRASGTMPAGSVWREHDTEGSLSSKEITLTPSRLSAIQAAKCDVSIREASSSALVGAGLAPEPVTEPPQARWMRGRRWLFAAAGVLILGTAAALFGSKNSAPTLEQLAPPTPSALSTAPRQEPGSQPSETPPEAVASAPRPAPAAPLASSHPTTNSAPAPKVRPGRARVEVIANKPATRASAEIVAPPPPPTPPSKRNTAWDSDSSLPPP